MLHRFSFSNCAGSCWFPAFSDGLTDIAGPLFCFQSFDIDNHQTIDAVAESRIDIEVKKDHATRLAEFGVLFIERGDCRAEVGEQCLELLEILPVVAATKFLSQGCQGFLKGKGITGTGVGGMA